MEVNYSADKGFLFSRTGLYSFPWGILFSCGGILFFRTGFYFSWGGFLFFNRGLLFSCEGFLFFNRGFYIFNKGFLFSCTGIPFSCEGFSLDIQVSPSNTLRTRSRTLANRTKPAPIPKFAKELALLTTRKAANSKWKLKNCPPSKN